MSVFASATSFTKPLASFPTVVPNLSTLVEISFTVVASALAFTLVVKVLIAVALSFVFLINPFVSSPTVSFNALIFVLFTSIPVALSAVFFTSPLSTSPTVFLISSTAVLSAFLPSSVSTPVLVYTSTAPGADSSTCTVLFAALATPNPPQRRESAIRDARRERLVTPPIFSEPEADLV